MENDNYGFSVLDLRFRDSVVWSLNAHERDAVNSIRETLQFDSDVEALRYCAILAELIHSGYTVGVAQERAAMIARGDAIAVDDAITQLVNGGV
jgi:hypothetical protein